MFYIAESRSDQGAILLNVLLISVLISIMIAGSFLLLGAPEKFYEDNLNQEQAYNNAQAGLLEGESQLGSTTVSGLVSEIKKGLTPPYSWSTPTSSTVPWNVTVKYKGYNRHLSNPSDPKSQQIYVLTFLITSTGTSKNAQEVLSLTQQEQST